MGLDLKLIRNALESHLRVLMDYQDEYRKNNNPEAAENVREEWFRVHEQKQAVEKLIRESEGAA